MRATTITIDEARERIRTDPSTLVQRGYEDALRQLDGERCLEVVPDEGETLRGIKLRLARASSETGVAIAYGDADDGSAVIVWLADRATGNGSTPKHRRKRAAASA